VDHVQLQKDWQLTQAVHDQVVAVLGREPISKAEAARVKLQIFRANPGLITALEAARKRLAAAAQAVSKNVVAGQTIEEVAQEMIDRYNALGEADRRNFMLQMARILPADG